MVIYMADGRFTYWRRANISLQRTVVVKAKAVGQKGGSIHHATFILQTSRIIGIIILDILQLPTECWLLVPRGFFFTKTTATFLLQFYSTTIVFYNVLRTFLLYDRKVDKDFRDIARKTMAECPWIPLFYPVYVLLVLSEQLSVLDAF